MSSATTTAAVERHTYWCHECDMSVSLLSSSTATSSLRCPHCSDFLEHMDSPLFNPNPNPNPSPTLIPLASLLDSAAASQNPDLAAVLHSNSDDNYLLDSPYLHRLIHHLTANSQSSDPSAAGCRLHSPTSKSALEAIPNVTITATLLGLDPVILCAVCKDQFLVGARGDQFVVVDHVRLVKMPHRTTYFFPRQFLDRGFDVSSKVFQDHEKKISKESVSGHRDAKASAKDEIVGGKCATKTKSDRFTGDKIHGRQLAAFVNWLAEKKGAKAGHVKVRLGGDDDDGDHENELLLPQEPPVVEASKDQSSDQPEVPLQGLSSGTSGVGPPATPEVVVVAGRERGFDRQLSLQRLSSGSSYAGSLFSGTTLDGNFSSGVKDSQVSTTREEDETEASTHSLAQRSRESYYLQITLAKRLSEQASLASEPPFLQQYSEFSGISSPDPETVSHRLWVSGCLSYTDKISNGFYNILGINPYLWVMCNNSEEGERVPSLVALKAVEPSDASLEVVLVDRNGDTRLKELEEKAQELYFASENTSVLVEKLGKLVAIYMGLVLPYFSLY